MATIRNLMIRLGIDYDEKGTNRLSRGLDNVVSKSDKAGKAMDKMRVPAFAVGLLSAAGAASQFAVALAPAAASALAMPAALSLGAASAVTLKVGLIGVGDAMKAVAEGDSKKLEVALKKLTPAARTFVIESDNFVKAFKPIRQAVQDRLFEGLGGQLSKVTKSILPTAKAGMVGLAGSFNMAGREALKFAASPVAKGLLNKVFATTKTVMDSAATAIRPVLNAVSKLVVLGLPLAQRFALWAVNGVKAGAAFVTSGAGAGKLAGLLQRAGEVLTTLGHIARNIGTTLFNVFKQAGNGSRDLLGSLEGLTAKMAAWSKSASGQQQASNAFKLLGDVAVKLATVLPLLLGPLGAIMKIILSLPSGMQGAVTTTLAFAVAGGALGGKLVTIASVGVKATSAIIQFGGGLVKGSAALANNASMAARAGGAMRGVAVAFAQGVAGSAKLIVQLGQQAGLFLVNTGRTIAMTTASVASTVASKAMAVGIKLVNLAMRANPIGIVITLLIALVAIVVTAYKKNEAFRNIVNKVWSFIKQFVANVITGLISLFKGLANWFTVTLPNALGKFWNSVKTIWNNVVGWIKSRIDIVKGHFNVLKNLVTVTVPNAFRTGVAAIGKFWTKVQDVAKKPVQFVVNTVYNKGIRGVWNWVASKVGLGQLPAIQGFAKGGILPGFSRKDNQIIAARSGEGIVVPEVVKELGSDFIHTANKKGGRYAIAKVMGFAGDPGKLGIPGFEGGGIVGFVSDFLGKAKDFFIKGFMKAVRVALNPMVQAAAANSGGTGFGGLVASAVKTIVNGVFAKFDNYESELSGGNGMRAVNKARTAIGTPYSWGGGGPYGPSYGIQQGSNIRGFDCSSLMQYGWYGASKKVIPRTTYSQRDWAKRVSKPVPGAMGQPNTGHTFMATNKGTVVEAPYTGARVRERANPGASWWGMPPWSFDNGGVWQPGTPGYNGTREPEYVFTRKQMQNGLAPNVQVIVHVDPITGKSTYEVLKVYKRQNGGKSLDL